MGEIITMYEINIADLRAIELAILDGNSHVALDILKELIDDYEDNVEEINEPS